MCLVAIRPANSIQRKVRGMRLIAWPLGALWIAGFLVSMPGLAAEEAIDFERQVRPIFVAHCVKCHGPDEASGGLRLDRGGDALAGGDSGQAIVPGKAAQSYLLERVQAKVEAERMPPEGEPLSADAIAVLMRWIEGGANWPGAEKRADPRLAHWSLQAVVRPAVPAIGEENTLAVDRFIRAKLADQGLTLSPPAEARTLVRRLYFDLIGLPPTLDEIEAYQRTAREHGEDRAYTELVDRLLASPRHGERWAQHWLDAVRFAESDGFETNKPRANAWPYRDYVIESLTADKPYDQFVREQLAGDILGADAATGFLVGGANDVVLSPDPVLTAQQRADVLHDMVSTTASTFLGLTVGCARCHNHKFDPIPQADYYALKAVLAGVSHGERPRIVPEGAERSERLAKIRARLDEIEAKLLRFEPLAQVVDGPTGVESALATKANPLRPAVHPKVNIDRFPPLTAKRLRFTVHKTNNLEPCIDELEVFAAGEQESDSAAPPAAQKLNQNLALATRGTTAKASSVYPNSSIHKLEHINDGLLGNGRSWISQELGGGWVELEFPNLVTIDAVRWGRDREEKYRDRLAIEYTIAVTTTAGDEGWTVVATSRDRQPFTAGKEPTAVAFDHLPPVERAAAKALAAERQKIEAEIAELAAQPMLYAGVFSASPPATHRLHRGDPMQPREEVLPAALSAVAVPFSPEAAADNSSLTDDARRRLALANWIVDPANPLTARVIVNRLWQHHFSEGIVATPSDYGANGARPTHPELLDWLAAELVEHGWSLRHIHRLIVTSATYRQASTFRPEAAAVDAQARLLWRYPPQRLSAEQIRDTLLTASGQLDLTAGGPGFLPFEPNSNYVRVYNPKQSFGPSDFRRMIYMTKIRMHQEATFGAFDCPDGGQIAPRRSQSTTPLQALNLLNGPFVVEQANFLAERIAAEAGDNGQSQVKHAFRLVLLREPSAEELAAGEQLVRQHGLASFCRAIFNANELLYVY
jgi:mono/diheme cytochrome c family protein